MNNLIFKMRLGWIIFLLFPFFSASAYDFEVDGIYYNVPDLSTLECEVTFGDNKYGGGTNIPSTVTFNSKTFTVKKIGKQAFQFCQGLTLVSIPNSVTSIGDEAFMGCSALRNIKIPDSVLSIGNKAFEYNTSLETVSIGNSVTRIGDDAFAYCTSLRDVKFGNSIRTIGKYAFENCESLESAILPNTVKNIGRNAFTDCESLSEVDLGDSLKELNYGTFNRCRNLIEITIPGSVERIVTYCIFDNNSSVFSHLQCLLLLYSDKELVCGGYNEHKKCFLPGTNHHNEPNFENGNTWTETIELVYFDRQLNYNMLLPRMRLLYLGEHIKTVQVENLNECEDLEVIKCRGTEPPKLPECSNKQYLNVVVMVPQEALEKYKQAPNWKNFFNLQGFDPSVD